MKRPNFSFDFSKDNVLKYAAHFSKIGTYLVAFGCISVMTLFLVYSFIVPAPDKLTNRKIEQSTKIYDRNGVLLYDVYENKDRTVISLDNVSPFVINATLATEDADFYKHQGFDVISYLRAGVNTARGEGLQGGSTLTQQLVKNALLTSDRTLIRKIKELILAVQIENKYGKDEIISYYLNETPYGGTSYGIEAASQLYFGKGSGELNLAEAAYLAGLPQSPSEYSFFGPTPQKGFDRQKYVLYLMKDRGWSDKNGEKHKISQEEYDAALAYELKFSENASNIRAPHFVFYVLDKLYEKYGEEYVKSAGLKVTTTLDIEKHDEVQKIVKEEVEKAAYLDVGNASLVAINPQSREIIAMVGSKDYFDEEVGSLNVSIQQTRQPGSSIKPLVYATALKQGYTASTVYMDVPTSFPGASADKPYQPKNYDGNFRGPIQMRYALANSINITAVKTLKLVGLDAFLQTAQDFGITSFNREPGSYGLSLALGGGEASLLQMTNAFGVFASGGYYQDPISVLKVEDKNGKNLNYVNESAKKRVLDEEIAFIISDILSDNSARLLAFGPGNLLEFRGTKVAVKTGTTDDIRDNWTIGYTKDIVVGVWSGNNDNTPMNSQLASGVTGAAPIWNRSIKVFLDPDIPNSFEAPKDVVKKEVGTITGGKPADGLEDKRWEFFVKGTEPEVRSDMIVELEVCEKDGKIANDKCKEDDKTEKREYIKLRALLEEWQKSTDEWVDKNYPKDKDEFKKFHPPTEKSKYDD